MDGRVLIWNIILSNKAQRHKWNEYLKLDPFLSKEELQKWKQKEDLSIPDEQNNIGEILGLRN